MTDNRPMITLFQILAKNSPKKWNFRNKTHFYNYL